MSDAARQEPVTECCGVRLRGAEYPICQEPIGAALDQLTAIEDHALPGRVGWWVAIATADLDHRQTVGRSRTGDRFYDHVLVDADDRLAKVERQTEDDLVREARQILLVVTENGGSEA